MFEFKICVSGELSPLSENHAIKEVYLNKRTSGRMEVETGCSPPHPLSVNKTTLRTCTADPLLLLWVLSEVPEDKICSSASVDPDTTTVTLDAAIYSTLLSRSPSAAMATRRIILLPLGSSDDDEQTAVTALKVELQPTRDAKVRQVTDFLKQACI